MIVRKFIEERDYEKVSQFLKECYIENKNMVCWLPERLDDLIYRVDTLYKEERGLEASRDYIYLFLEEDKIVGMIIPDGDSFNTCIRNGYEEIFGQMLDIGVKELLPLFEEEKDGNIDFLVISHDSLEYQKEELIRRGYVQDEAKDYDNVMHVSEKEYVIQLPKGYYQVYGENLEDNRKAKACHYGFQKDDDDGILTGDFREGALSYQARKKSKFYQDSFESLIVTEENDICSL